MTQGEITALFVVFVCMFGFAFLIMTTYNAEEENTSKGDVVKDAIKYYDQRYHNFISLYASLEAKHSELSNTIKKYHTYYNNMPDYINNRLFNSLIYCQQKESCDTLIEELKSTKTVNTYIDDWWRHAKYHKSKIEHLQWVLAKLENQVDILEKYINERDESLKKYQEDLEAQRIRIETEVLDTQVLYDDEIQLIKNKFL